VRRRRGATVAALAAATLLLAGCTGDGDPTPPTVTVTATPDAEPTAAFVPPPVLLTVPAAVVDGVDIEVESSAGGEFHTYAAFPVIPGAQTLTDQIRTDIEARFDRFRSDAEPDGDEPPELQIAWDLVGSSPDIVGVRTHSIEYGGSGFDGRARTYWYDTGSGEVMPATDLLDTSDMLVLLGAITDAAAGDPRIDPALLSAQLDGGVEAFDSVAFTVDGGVWIEFDRAQVSTSREPVGVEISADDHLSDLGRVARAAALEPQDPAIPVVEPDETTAPTEPSVPQPPAATITQPAGDVDCAAVKCIALTFDDGPVDATVDLVEVLEERGVRATFFMVGNNVRAHPGVVRRIHDGGHALGNHTMDHPDLTRLDAASVRSEIAEVNALIEDATGVRPVLLRPPYGATNGTVAEIAAQEGMAQILWNVDPEDWRDKDAQVVTERVLANARNGAIVLSHDIHASTRAAYAGIVDALLADGYTLVTVPELLGDLTPGAKYFSR